MKLPDLPEEEPKPKTDEQPKRKPAVVIHRAMMSHRPAEADKKPIFLFRRKPVPGPTDQGQTPAASSPRPASTTDLQPGSRHQTGSQAAPPPPPEDLADRKPEPRSRTESQPMPPARSSGQGVPARQGKGINPGLRLRAFEAAARNAPSPKIPPKFRLLPDGGLTRRAYWDVASAFSLIVNAILVGVLLVMAVQVKNLKATVNGLLGGLYGNFVEMDKASINTTIKVKAQIPISINLPISQNTDVTLTRDVPIPGAHVVINAGLFTVNAPANVTLPAGTSLPIALNMEVPLQLTVPIDLEVPVNIPLNQTALHTPFTGLQQTIRPLYCALNKNAQYPDGVFICAEHDTPTPGTP